jgi:biopolymer transport protein ExbD
MRRRVQQEQPEAALDISPLIDVVFLLLIFFMVTATFVKDADLELERPGAQSATRSSDKAIRVFVDRDSQVWIDELAVQPWMVQSRVRDLLRTNAEASVVVVTDRRVPAEVLIDVVDQCRLAGAKNVGVATDSEAG